MLYCTTNLLIGLGRFCTYGIKAVLMGSACFLSSWGRVLCGTTWGSIHFPRMFLQGKNCNSKNVKVSGVDVEDLGIWFIQSRNKAVSSN
jgi:hypothetical protein